MQISKLRVVLADESERMRLVVADLLRTRCEVAVAGSARNGAQAVDVVVRLQPEILILEVIMPVVDGIQGTRKLRKIKSATRILLTAVVDPLFQSAAIAAGAQAYVIKARMSMDLPEAISTVTRGEVYVSMLSILRRVLLDVDLKLDLSRSFARGTSRY